MVTKAIFQSLEQRVSALELSPPAFVSQMSPEVAMLREQVDRLDPANRSLRFSGFRLDSVDARVACIEAIFSKHGLARPVKIESIWKGSRHDRLLSPICILEFVNREFREKKR